MRSHNSWFEQGVKSTPLDVLLKVVRALLFIPDKVGDEVVAPPAKVKTEGHQARVSAQVTNSKQNSAASVKKRQNRNSNKKKKKE